MQVRQLEVVSSIPVKWRHLLKRRMIKFDWVINCQQDWCAIERCVTCLSGSLTLLIYLRLICCLVL